MNQVQHKEFDGDCECGHSLTITLPAASKCGTRHFIRWRCRCGSRVVLPTEGADELEPARPDWMVDEPDVMFGAAVGGGDA